MRKSVLLIVAITYVASIVVVGLFGMSFTSYNENLYAESIVVYDNDGNVVKHNGILYLPTGVTEYQINTVVFPRDATNQNLKYIVGLGDGEIEVNNNGLITIIDDSFPLAAITVTTRDGTNISQTFYIMYE